MRFVGPFRGVRLSIISLKAPQTHGFLSKSYVCLSYVLEGRKRSVVRVVAVSFVVVAVVVVSFVVVACGKGPLCLTRRLTTAKGALFPLSLSALAFATPPCCH